MAFRPWPRYFLRLGRHSTGNRLLELAYPLLCRIDLMPSTADREGMTRRCLHFSLSRSLFVSPILLVAWILDSQLRSRYQMLTSLYLPKFPANSLKEGIRLFMTLQSSMALCKAPVLSPGTNSSISLRQILRDCVVVFMRVRPSILRITVLGRF